MQKPLLSIRDWVLDGRDGVVDRGDCCLFRLDRVSEPMRRLYSTQPPSSKPCQEQNHDAVRCVALLACTRHLSQRGPEQGWIMLGGRRHWHCVVQEPSKSPRPLLSTLRRVAFSLNDAFLSSDLDFQGSLTTVKRVSWVDDTLFRLHLQRPNSTMTSGQNNLESNTALATVQPSDDETTLAESRQVFEPEKMGDSGMAAVPTSNPADSGPISTSPAEEKPITNGPPPLPYNLREHKLTITIFWFLIFTECTLIPIIFYFTIANLTDMRRGAMFAIITACFGFISGGEYGLRGLRLAWKSDKWRPLNGAGRWGFDSTHIILGQPYFVMTALMIGFSIPDPPIMRGLSMIMPVGILMCNFVMAYTGIAYQLKWRLPFRLSSHVKGDPVPPLTFCILEDIGGCDGDGQKAFRQAALDRYNASPRFRRMLVQMLWAWTITGMIMSVALLVIIWIPSINQEVVYALGWTVPSAWGAIGAYLTIKFGQRSIRKEEAMWAEDQAAQLNRG
jgi:hypothetical protein